PRISNKTRAILISHLFGCQNKLSAIRQIADKHNIIVVEDCAQSFDGESTGSTDADVSMYSFGMIKTHTALCGAKFIIRNDKLNRIINARVSELPTLPPLWFALRILKAMGLKVFSSPPFFGMFALFVGLFKIEPDQLLYRLTRGFGNT